MNLRTINIALATTALASLPALSGAAESSLMRDCMSAFKTKLSAGRSTPLKVREGSVVDTTDGTLMALGYADALVLTARDARNNRAIATVVCTIDSHGQVTLKDDVVGPLDSP